MKWNEILGTPVNWSGSDESLAWSRLNYRITAHNNIVLGRAVRRCDEQNHLRTTKCTAVSVFLSGQVLTKPAITDEVAVYPARSMPAHCATGLCFPPVCRSYPRWRSVEPMISGAVPMELFTARLLYRVSNRVLDYPMGTRSILNSK